ncbi:MAG: DinB family protein [Dongiaceae bacterium]
MSPDYFRRFARYNAWANRRLYHACGSLTDADYRAKRAAFFGSIHATLNHILVGDRIWLSRFENRPHEIKSLDQILHDDLATLQSAREAEDARILAFADGLGEAALSDTLNYRNMAGQQVAIPLVAAIAHFFNHQTHHRGQVHGMLSGTPVPPPPLDLLYFLPEDTALSS